MIALVCAFYVMSQGAALPDPVATPGDLRPVTAVTVCSQRTKTVRHVTAAQKRAVYAAYGAKKKPGICCEVDHFIPLELGGSNDAKNLWPQPYQPRPGAHEKDALENHLHAMVCKEQISLAEAHQRILTDWYATYIEFKPQFRKSTINRR